MIFSYLEIVGRFRIKNFAPIGMLEKWVLTFSGMWILAINQ